MGAVGNAGTRAGEFLGSVPPRALEQRRAAVERFVRLPRAGGPAVLFMPSGGAWGADGPALPRPYAPAHPAR